MSNLPTPPPTDRYCGKHTFTHLNPSGYCPKCLEEEQIKAEEREKKKKRLKQAFENIVWPDSTKKE